MTVQTRRCVLVLLLGVVACAAPPRGRKDLLDFLTDGVTRREEVLATLGPPSARFEDSRILAYRLTKGDGGYLISAIGGTWTDIDVNLMLAFDRDGVLKRHSLVQIRAP
jgi:hypothetical protein